MHPQCFSIRCNMTLKTCKEHQQQDSIRGKTTKRLEQSSSGITLLQDFYQIQNALSKVLLVMVSAQITINFNHDTVISIYTFMIMATQGRFVIVPLHWAGYDRQTDFQLQRWTYWSMQNTDNYCGSYCLKD